MLVTPWFAAGAGFVIAAALALNSPHTVLTYRPNMTPCAGSPCAEPGALPTAGPGVQMKRAKPAHVSKPPSKTRDGAGSSAGPLVGYHVVWNHDGEFAAIITIPAQQAKHGWDLSFRFPGRHVTQVWGAQWRPYASGDGGVASILVSTHSGPGQGNQGPPGGQGWPGSDGGSGDSGDSGWQGNSGPAGQTGPAGLSAAASQYVASQDSSAADGYQGSLRFLVTVQASPVTPVDCVLNQHACHFG